MPNTGAIYLLMRAGANFIVLTAANSTLNPDGQWHEYCKVFTNNYTGTSTPYAILVGYRNNAEEWLEVADESMRLIRGSQASLDTVSEIGSRVTQTEQDITRLFTNSSAGLDIRYISSTSATTAPADTAAWQETMPARATDKYIWMWVRKYAFNASQERYLQSSTKTCISGADGSPGQTGTAGGRWYSGTGITGTSTTATIFSGSGVASAVVGDMYLNTSTWNTYRCTVAGAASVA